MKGSNDTNSWSIDQAQQDSGEILYSDMHIEFATSEQVKERYAEPELTQDLQAIEAKFSDSSQTYPYSQWSADMQNLENIAKYKYNLGDPTGIHK